jgi:tripartite-type tricarboxylate transporter receptor subunit TctC
MLNADTSRLFCTLLLCFAATICADGAAAGEAYPMKPIRLILPQPPGGAVDFVARLLSTRLADNLGQSVIVDNRPGANGGIAASLVARAAPDGYTLFMAVDTNLVVNPNLYRNLPYDPYRDFVPISIVVRLANVLVVNPSLRVNSIKELVELAKTKPGKLNYASFGNGTVQHLGMELFKAKTQINLTHVPYKGMAPALTELIAGRIDVLFTGIAFASPHAATGALKMLAIGSPQRSDLIPEVPTMQEAGVPGFDITTWEGVLAPAKTPSSMIRRLLQEITKAVADPGMRNALHKQGFEAFGSSPHEMLAIMKSDTAKWAEVIRTSGAKIE